MEYPVPFSEETAIARTFYITTAIDYVNALPHLGTAYEKIGADVLARFHRLAGDDVFFLMGNDEHSQNVLTAARKEGLEPRDYCDLMEPKFRNAWDSLDISFDDFIRTTEPRHRIAVEELLRRFHERGDLYRGRYEGWYCVGCEAFIPDKDLLEGTCPHHRTEPQWISEENWFFRLSSYTERLKEHYASHPEFVRPESHRNQMLKLLEEGLQDVSVSREGSTWGVPFPFDPTTVVYVWFDALINYLSGAGFGSDEEKFARYWPANVHVVGKDITRFHCVIWPAMLLSAGIELPETISVHGFLSVAGQKLSKSLGTIIDPRVVVDDWGADPVRYFLMREMSWGRDGDYTEKRLDERYHHDLGNDLGNLLNRVLNMADRYLVGPTKNPPADVPDHPLRVLVESVHRRYVERMRELDPPGAIIATWEVVTRANGMIEEEEPWRLAKEPESRERLDSVLWHLLASLRHVILQLYPVMPGKMTEAWSQLGLGEIRAAKLSDLETFTFPEGIEVKKGSPLFPRRE